MPDGREIHLRGDGLFDYMVDRTYDQSRGNDNNKITATYLELAGPEFI